MSMTVGLLAKWLYVMNENCDYRDYCVAVTESNSAKCEELEAKFEKLASLYADWGDIQYVNADPESDSFKQWLRPRESLFFRNAEIKAIAKPECYVSRPGHLLLDVPLLDTKTKTIEALHEYIDKVYAAQRSATDETGQSLGITGTVHADKPKYHLIGVYNKKTEGRLHKAFYFRYWLRLRPVLKKGELYWGRLSVTEIVKVLKQDPDNPFGWTLSEDDTRALKNGRSVKTIFLDTERTQIKRSISDLKGYIHNTIHGRFPDPTPAL